MSSQSLFFSKIRKNPLQQLIIHPPNILALGKNSLNPRKVTRRPHRAYPLLPSRFPRVAVFWRGFFFPWRHLVLPYRGDLRRRRRLEEVIHR